MLEQVQRPLRELLAGFISNHSCLFLHPYHRDSDVPYELAAVGIVYARTG